MRKNICVRCGIEFETIRKTAVCPNCHTAVCVICGNEFKLKHPYNQKTCSPKCRSVYVKQSGIAKARTIKATDTLRRKYGVSNSSELQHFKKTCKYCGKEFETDSARREYCYDKHYGPCPVCGKPTEIKEMRLGPQACSEECRQKRIQDTSLERYGSTNVFSSEYGKNKIKETMLSKYGVDNYSKTDEYKSEFKLTMLERYGVTNPRKDKEINKKAVNTCVERYGGASPSCDKTVALKASDTVKRNFGGFGMASPELSKRIRQTNIDRYGVEIPTQSNEIYSKIKETNKSRYGFENYNQSIYGIRKSISDPSKAENFMKFRQDPEDYLQKTYGDTKVSVDKLSKDLGVTSTPVYDILLANNCRDLTLVRSSSMEYELYDHIKSILPDIEVQKNNRTVIKPMELDLYVPILNFGIECNPTITHNSSVVDPWGMDAKPYSYHKHKSVLARNAGVFLFHIFGYEWTHRKDIILSMIDNIIGVTKNKVYARNTYICEVSNKECIEFLNKNHRQGETYASIRLGLRDKTSDELVSVMTFNRMRSTIGRTSDDDNSWELSRFCSKLYTSVAGGASKLFKHFTRNYNYSKIVSFSDIAHTRGSLYASLGFFQVRESNPSYVWVNYKTDEYLHRVQCQKSNMHRLFPNEDLDLQNKTERQIMEEHGYVRVYDSGTIRWEYVNPK